MDCETICKFSKNNFSQTYIQASLAHVRAQISDTGKIDHLQVVISYSCQVLFCPLYNSNRLQLLFTLWKPL